MGEKVIRLSHYARTTITQKMVFYRNITITSFSYAHEQCRNIKRSTKSQHFNEDDCFLSVCLSLLVYVLNVQRYLPVHTCQLNSATRGVHYNHLISNLQWCNNLTFFLHIKYLLCQCSSDFIKWEKRRGEHFVKFIKYFLFFSPISLSPLESHPIFHNKGEWLT